MYDHNSADILLSVPGYVRSTPDVLCVSFHSAKFQHFFHISDHGCIHFDIFVDFRRIHINLQDFCLIANFFGISCTRSLKRAQGDQKITLTVTPRLEVFCSMHTKHTGIKLILSWESTFSHQGVTDRCLYL